MKKLYMAIDQYGTVYRGLENPRKDLLERLGYKHAEIMYRDKADGSTVKVGYIIGGQWLRLYEYNPVEIPVEF